GRVLPGDLPQELTSEPQGVSSDDLRHGLLDLVVVGEPELRDVGLNPYRSDTIYRYVGQSICGRVSRADRKVETDPAKGKPQLIGPGWTDDPVVGSQQVLRAPVKIEQEPRPVYPIRSRDCVVDQVPYGQAMIGVESMVDSTYELPIVLHLSRRHTDRAEFNGGSP